MKEILFYTHNNGKIPVLEWMNSLDSLNKARIYARLARIQEGNLGDYKKLDSEISEFRFKFGSGYRIYYSEIDNIVILLINAGDKKSQPNDIKKAKEYLENAQEIDLSVKGLIRLLNMEKERKILEQEDNE